MRGAYYAHTRTLGGTPGSRSRRPRKRETTTSDAIESATIVLTRAIEAIDAEIESAKARADEAQTEYKQLRDSAQDRKQAIQAKIDALNA
jgi:hypothetical protein